MISFTCEILRKTNSYTQNRFMVTRSRGWRCCKWMKVVKKDKLPLINKYWGCNVQHADQLIPLYGMRVNSISSYHKEKNYNYVKEWILSNLTVVIILQYIQIYQIILRHIFKTNTMLHVSYISVKNKIKQNIHSITKK